MEVHKYLHSLAPKLTSCCLVVLIYSQILTPTPVHASVVSTPRPHISASPFPPVSASPHFPFSASAHPPFSASPHLAVPQAAPYEYLWYEAEDMRGFATQPNGEPVLNPSWQDPPRSKAPGWGMNGTGTSAEFTQGGASEWGSAAASADESRATIFQDVEIPSEGQYKLWVRYADWSRRSENFVVRITQGPQDLMRHEFGARDLIDAHDETIMYWQWAFTWDSAAAKLPKGPARISIEIEKTAGARRHVDCLVLTNDQSYKPAGRQKPDFAAARYLRSWSNDRAPLSSFLTPQATTPAVIKRSPLAGRDFVMPWNITPEFWNLYQKPPSERPLYPFHTESVDQFVQKYKGDEDVPIFSSEAVVPVVYLNEVPQLLKEGSGFLKYLRDTKAPFAILINYAQPQMPATDAPAAWQLLNGELKDQFIGWISGESIGHVWGDVVNDLRLSPTMSRKELLQNYRVAYNDALTRKWQNIFQNPTGPMWDKLIPAQSTSSTAFAHPLSEWGVRLLGIETAAVQPMFAMRTAFTRGATRQYGSNFLYYHAPNFGDTATTFTKAQAFGGPDNFFHSRYGATMGPSLSWYRKSYYFYYMSGASAIYLEQGYDQFFKPGPGEHEFQLNPLGRITDEFTKFVATHPDRGVPYTPIAILLDPAHGWDMTDYPHWPLGISQLTRHDRALRELFGVAYFPGLVTEGEPATGDRQAFVNGIFGDIFDVIVAAEEVSTGAPTAKAEPSLAKPASTPQPKPAINDLAYEGSVPPGAPANSAIPAQPTAVHAHRSALNILDAYRAVVVGGRIDWPRGWPNRLADYVRSGGTVVLNAAQVQGLPQELVGLRVLSATAESNSARCGAPAEPPQDLKGQIFRYQKVELTTATPIITSDAGDPLMTINKVGKGAVVFVTLPDLLGIDERLTPFVAHALAHVFADATPVKVRGDVEYLVNRNEQGWVVTLINNNGVYKPQQGMATVDRTAYVTAKLSMKAPIAAATDWITEKILDVTNEGGESGATISIPPGGIAIVQLASGSRASRPQ